MRNISNIKFFGPTLAEAKEYLRIDNNVEDSLISMLITASYDQVTAECNRQFAPCTQSFNAVSSSGYIFLSTQTVDKLSTGSLHLDADGSQYAYFEEVFSGPIVFTQASASIAVPNNVRVAQMMLVDSFYENRLPESMGVSTSPISFTVSTLLNPYKLIKPQ